MMVVVVGSGRFYGPVLGAAIALLLPGIFALPEGLVSRRVWLRGRHHDDLAAGRTAFVAREALLLRKAKREAKQKELSERAAAAAGKGTVEAA